jgi:hypothetical protein
MMVKTTQACTSDTCEFCGRFARRRSQEVSEAGEPLRRAVLACDKHKTSGQLLATTTVKLGAHIGT